MKNYNFIRACGSIVKKESIVPLKTNILENTVVAEAYFPYSNYYGNVPKNPNPNSLFLVTKPFYTLEEVLRFSQKIDSCIMEKINVASAVLECSINHYPAIRIKNLPNYNQLPMLQNCFLEQGVKFSKKVPLGKNALVKINKCFILEEVEDGIFMDYTEENKGYILIEKLLNQDEFDLILSEIRNNSDCRLFDAEKGGIILNSEVKEIMRVFSEKLDIPLLKNIQAQINKYIPLIKKKSSINDLSNFKIRHQ